jgi:hypothetical protein
MLHNNKIIIINIISDNKREMEEDKTYRIRIRSSLHDILLTHTPFHSRTANESGAMGNYSPKASAPGVQLDSGVSSCATTATTPSPSFKETKLVPESPESF